MFSNRQPKMCLTADPRLAVIYTIPISSNLLLQEVKKVHTLFQAQRVIVLPMSVVVFVYN